MAEEKEFPMTLEGKKKLEEEKSALEQLKNGPQTDDTIRQQEALTREIADTEQQLKSLTKEYQNFGSVAGQEIQTAGKKIDAIVQMLPGSFVVSGIMVN